MTTMPPSPVVMIFVEWKEKHPASARAPARRPSSSAPCACAASSTTKRPVDRIRAANSGNPGATRPPKCTTIAPRVRSVTRDQASSKSIEKVSVEISVKTGHPPTKWMVMPVAVNVCTGTRTSSLGCVPRARRALSSAAVQLGKATPYSAPQKFANSCSNLATRGPIASFPSRIWTSSAWSHACSSGGK